MVASGRPPEYKHRKHFTTSFEEELILEFQKACAKEGLSVNKVLTSFIEGFLRTKNPDNHLQSNIDLFVHNPGVIVTPELDASKEEWKKYWDSITDANQVARLEGLYFTRHKEANARFYQLKRQGYKQTIAYYKY